MNPEKLEEMRSLAIFAVSSSAIEPVFTAKQCMELIDEIDRLNFIICQNDNMKFKEK